jgi:hypothetical protein
MCLLLNHTDQQLVTDEPHKKINKKPLRTTEAMQNFMTMVQKLKCEFLEYGNLFLP